MSSKNENDSSTSFLISQKNTSLSKSTVPDFTKASNNQTLVTTQGENPSNETKPHKKGLFSIFKRPFLPKSSSSHNEKSPSKPIIGFKINETSTAVPIRPISKQGETYLPKDFVRKPTVPISQEKRQNILILLDKNNKKDQKEPGRPNNDGNQDENDINAINQKYNFGIKSIGERKLFGIEKHFRLSTAAMNSAERGDEEQGILNIADPEELLSPQELERDHIESSLKGKIYRVTTDKHPIVFSVSKEEASAQGEKNLGSKVGSHLQENSWQEGFSRNENNARDHFTSQTSGKSLEKDQYNSGRQGKNDEEYFLNQRKMVSSLLFAIRNSILQALFNTPLFSTYFSRGDHMKEINRRKDKGIAKNFASLLTKIKSATGPPSYSAESTYALKKCIEEANSMFSGYEQHDAQEFLKALLEGVHEDLNRITSIPPYKELKADIKKPLQTISTEWFTYMLGRDNSIVTDLFSGQLLSRTTCIDCKYESLAFDNFWDLSLSFTRGLSMLDRCELMRMFEHFLKEEMLDDLFYCEKCKRKTKFKKGFVLWRLPKILVVHLKRFHYGKYKREKIRQSVVFPVKNLDLSQYVRESKDDSVEDPTYTLFAVVNHSGSLDGGHYTADCMNLYNRKWYNFNDSSVSESRSIRDNASEAEGENPYILFYVKTSCL